MFNSDLGLIIFKGPFPPCKRSIKAHIGWTAMKPGEPSIHIEIYLKAFDAIVISDHDTVYLIDAIRLVGSIGDAFRYVYRTIQSRGGIFFSAIVIAGEKGK